MDPRLRGDDGDAGGEGYYLNPHRHDNVFEVCVIRNRNQGRRVRIAKGDVDLVNFQIVQYVEQVGHVEADIHAVAAVVDLEFFDRFFLVGISRADLHAAWGDDA